ncbi:MAG: DUF3788 domain-containing protein [Spirochaetes bacterium]|nr:DUF3788 domain-containing protein [Spirochaetota bacterium]MBU1079265.1 DUF3788 domain-containing protein [Spirochaetota bacterium]
MEQINAVELADPSVYPDEAVLRGVLGAGYGAYGKFMDALGERGYTHEWRYYTDGKAWLCKAQRKAKTLAWMSAWRGYVKATVYLPERYLEGLAGLALSDDARRSIDIAKDVGKSRPCTVDLLGDPDVADILALMDYKASLK